jgi:PilZ domain
MRSTAQVLVPGAQPVAVRTTDLSPNGLGIVAPVNPPQGLEILLKVAIPKRPAGHHVIEVRARVMHSVFSRRDDGFRIGLALVAPSLEASKVIVDFLNR